MVEVRFDGVYPTLNSRSFPAKPNRLLPILKQWSPHVRKIDLWGDDDSIQPDFLNILGTLGNLKAFRHVYFSPSPGARLDESKLDMLLWLIC